MRVTRGEWDIQFFHPRPMTRPKRVLRMQHAQREPKELVTWRLVDGLIEVRAHTKSEARAQLKRRLGLTRLPPGTMLTRAG